MPPFRSFFHKTNVGVDPNDENQRPGSKGADEADPAAQTKSSALNIKGTREEPNEYKMSVVNDSGVYLPPSPPDKKSFWHRSPNSTTSSNHRSMLSETETFSISRESFESYRRSFDISGRSPITRTDSLPRASLDSRTARLPRSAINGNTFEKPEKTEEEGFEDVGLNDDPKPKKKGFLSRFNESTADAPSTGTENARPSSSHHGFHLPGRKRGQSGVGAELGSIERPSSKGKGDGVVR